MPAKNRELVAESRGWLQSGGFRVAHWLQALAIRTLYHEVLPVPREVLGAMYWMIMWILA